MEYLCNVAVHGVSALTFREKDYTHLPNPYVTVIVFDEQRDTHYLTSQASGSFSYIFTYNKRMKPEEFAASDAQIEVWHRGVGGIGYKMGTVVFSLRQVWNQPNKTVRRCWVPLCLSDYPGEVCGYVQLTVGAYGPGDIIPRIGGGGDDETSADDGGFSFQSRLVKPPKTSEASSMYQLTVRVHRADEIRELPTTFSYAVDPFVEVSFNGLKEKTAVQYGNRTPLWNQKVLIPFTMPCWDDSINVVLYSAGGTLGADVKMGELALHITELEKAELKPTWYNFYYSPEEASKGLFSGTIDEEEYSAFAGRLLISAIIERADKPVLSVSSCDGADMPSLTKCNIWLDIYELCFDSSELPGFVKVSATMQPLDDVWEFGESERHSHAFVWPDERGRQSGLSIQVPPYKMAADLIITVEIKPEDGWLSYDWQRHMFCRLPLSAIWHWRTEPDWYEMHLVLKEGAHTTGGFALMSINMGPENNKPTNRPHRVDVHLQDYIFRAHIYQAVNLPCKKKPNENEPGTCDPRIIMFFGSAMISSSIIAQSLTPTWHESMEELVELPKNENLRPDIFIYVVDMNRNSTGKWEIDPLAIHKYESSKEGALPERWDKAPVWLTLDKMNDGPVTQAKLLVKFELLPVDSSPETLIPISPETIKCDIEVFLIGIRMKHGHQDIKHPVVELSWGRSKENRAEPVKERHVGDTADKQIVYGDSGQYNFMETTTMKVPLSKDTVFQEYLEVRLLVETEDDKMKPCAFGSIHLTPFLPWVKKSKAAEIRKQFKMMTYEELKVDTEMRQAVIPPTETKHSPREDPGAKSKTWKRVGDGMLGHTGMSILEHRLCNSIGWNHPSIDASNQTTLDKKEIANITEDDERRCTETLLHIRKESKATKKAKTEDSENKSSAKLLQKSRSLQAGALDAKPDVAEETSEAFDAFFESFNWPMYKDDGDDALYGHPEFDHELEVDQLPELELPYLKTPLFVGRPWGEQLTIGHLKFCLRIVESDRRKEGGPDYEHETTEWKNAIKDLQDKIDKTKFLVARGYLLSADGLIPHSGRSDPNTYLWSRMSEDDGDRRNCDDQNVRKHSLHPEFFKVHQFEKCELPQNCFAEFKVIEQVPALIVGAGESKEIGNTIIDIEDRWFHPRYQKWFEDDAVPIEARALRSQDSMFNHGHLRLWFEVMTTDEANTTRKTATTLPSSEPRSFELRIVIWRATNVNFSGDAKPDVYIIGKHTKDDGTVVEQQTDTHRSCDDEIATWNWRWKFPVAIPCQDPRISMVMWDHNDIMASEPVADATLDFSRDFLQAKKTNDIIEFPRGSIPMTHPSNPGDVRAWLELEGVLIPADEADMNPVGEGRDDPNQDPFLDPEDKHLAAHRGFGALEAVQNAAYVGNLLFAGFGIMTALYVVVAAIGGLVSFGLTLYMVTK